MYGLVRAAPGAVTIQRQLMLETTRYQSHFPFRLEMQCLAEGDLPVKAFGQKLETICSGSSGSWRNHSRTIAGNCCCRSSAQNIYNLLANFLDLDEIPHHYAKQV
jgi:hypothetical protein